MRNKTTGYAKLARMGNCPDYSLLTATNPLVNHRDFSLKIASKP